ncbi:MAG: aminotransferase class V-fold PLP-dependent enzyme [Thermoleophilia bacterium]|nr:aminotransferase class V-fold PLP-dependent enzyme [Thermoleophilia bacterium]
MTREPATTGNVATAGEPPGSPARYDLAAWRRRIPLLQSFIPMNNCSQSPQLDVTRAAAEAYLDSWNEAGMDWDAWMIETYRAKEVFARLINASPDEIAVACSVSEATASLAGAFDLSGPLRKVVVSEAEFPSVGHVWLAHEKLGLEVDWVPVREGLVHLDDYETAIDEHTLLVSACHGYYQNGFVQDVAAIARLAHERGAMIYVDAYQSMGVEPIDVKAMDVDFLASGNLKYLLGVPGIAFLYVRRELLDRLHPAVTGWFGRENPFAFTIKDLTWAPTAARFDTGTPPVINAYISRAGMEVIEQVGVPAINEWTRVLSARLVEGGQARGFSLHGTSDPSRKTPSTAFFCPGVSHEVEVLMRRRGVIAAARGPVIRLAPHFYSTLEECDFALDALLAVFEQDLPAGLGLSVGKGHEGGHA